jgi:TonB-linked SusC/RagA family outer membrane protein
MMKSITSLIKVLTITLSLLHFGNAYGQVKEIPVSDALKKITTRYKTKFVYEPAILRGKKTAYDVDNSKEQSVEELLKSVLYPNNLLFLYISNNHYTIVSKEDRETQVNQNTESSTYYSPIIRGTVVDENNLPMPGVNISVKGKSNRTSSDNSGNYSIPANREDLLVFTFIGYRPIERAAGAQNQLNISMEVDVSQLKDVEIVSTGYQRLSRERSAGSYAKPDMEILQNRSSSMNIAQRLDGLVPGLAVNNAPGTETLLIRGLTSINGTASPLFVVDGVVLDNNNIPSINPNDVADISILKDATAASIWGSNAANGVVVITTKKGSNSGKIRVDYDGFVNFQGRPETDYLPSLNSAQFIQAARDIFDPVLNPYATVTRYSPTTWKPVPAHEQILYNVNNLSATEVDAQLNALAAIDNRGQINDLFYRDALLTNHTISLSGGSEKYSFYGSAAYTGMQNSTPDNNNNTYKVNLRQDFKFSDRIQMYLITDLTNTRSSAKRYVSPTTMFLPYTLFKDESNNNISMPWLYFPDADRATFESKSELDLNYNPLDEVDRGYTNSNGLLARINTGLDVKLFKGLKFQGVYGLVKGNGKTRSANSDESFIFRRELAQFTQAGVAGAKPKYFLPERGSIFEVNNNMQESWNVRNQLVFDQSFNNQKHQLTALAGQEIRRSLSTANGSTVRGYDEQLLTYGLVDYATLAGTGMPTPVLLKGSGNNKLDDPFFSAGELDVRFRSYYANMGYTFDQKYTFNASGRLDQSNLFGKDKSAQNKPVWSVGGAWLISNENFMGNQQWVDRLNLRATYGLTGNAPAPGGAASFDIFAAQTNAIFPGGRGLVLTTPGNQNLSWESTKTFNLGLDFSVFKRISGSVDVYSKKTENLIGDLVVNPFTGFTTIEGNQGALKNNGVELSLSSLNITSRDFSWRTLLTLGYNKNEVTDLYSKTPITTGAGKVSQRFVQGYSAYSVFAYQYAGLDNTGAPQIKLQDGTVTATRNLATPDDIVYMGSFQPKWTGGLSNNFKYKDFGLQFNAVYNLGFVMRRDVNRFYFGGRLVPDVGSFTTGNVHAEFADRWKKAGDEAFTDIPAYIGAKTDTRELNYYYLADKNVVDASYIKLRDITLSYSLPKKLISSIKVENISFRAQVSNIMLWKANDYGIDPEFQSAAAGTRNMPSNQKTVTLGAHVTF